MKGLISWNVGWGMGFMHYDWDLMKAKQYKAEKPYDWISFSGALEFSQIWAGKLGLYPLPLHKPFINFNLNKQKCIS